MKITIADQTDLGVDSAVFIEGGSISSIPEPGGLILVLPVFAMVILSQAWKKRTCAQRRLHPQPKHVVHPSDYSADRANGPAQPKPRP